MRKQMMIAASIATLALAGACSSHKVKLSDAESSVNNAGGVEMKVLWVKDKGRSIDMSVRINNQSPSTIGFKKASWHMTFVNRPADEVSSYFFPEEIDANGSETSTVVFKFDGKLPKKGHGILTVDPIYNVHDNQNKEKLAPLKFEFDVD